MSSSKWQINRLVMVFALLFIVAAGFAIYGFATRTSTTVSTGEKTLVELAQEEGKVTFVHAYGDVNYAEAWALFTQKYGIEIEGLHITPKDTYARIKSEYEGGVYAWDVLELHIATYMQPLIDEGYLMQYYPNESSVYPATLKDPRGFYVAGILNPHGLAFNPSKLSQEDYAYLDTWSVATNPRWKGRIGIVDYSLVTWQLVGLYQYWGSAKLTEWMTALLAQEPLMYATDGDLLQSLARGEVDVVVHLPVSNVHREKLAGSSVDWSLNVTGNGALVANGFAVFRKPPHPNAAKLFVEFLLSEEGQNATGQHITVCRPGLQFPASNFNSQFLPVLNNVIVVNATAVKEKQTAIQQEFTNLKG